MQTAAQPIQTRIVEPAQEQDDRAMNPTATRYGWCPFGDINLRNPDGTINMYVQPHDVDMNGRAVPNEHHGMLPKGQLIPFPTFQAIEFVPSDDEQDRWGRPVQVESRRLTSALEAIGTVKNRYSAWGFTIIGALQGLDQDTAFRIFQVVHPLAYPLGDLQNELTFGAEDRIDSEQPITFPQHPQYIVAPLQSDEEREIARKVAEQMSVGADIAVALAEEKLDKTVQSLTQKFSGGKGKDGPDALDKRLSAEMGLTLPKIVEQSNKDTGLSEKIDFLVGREQTRSQQEQIDALMAENARLRAAPVAAVDTICGRPKANGDPCQYPTKNGEPCHLHKAE